MILLTISVLTTLLFSTVNHAADNKVPYPTGYRNWTHVKSMVIKPGHPLENPFQGIHHIYGNEKALKGLVNGDFSDGSILVFDLLQYSDKDKTIQETKRKLVGVMYKDSHKYTNTGGWGFEGFAANSQNKRLTTDGGASCFSCHSPQSKNGYVFSKFRN
jgi:hypothetical protein